MAHPIGGLLGQQLGNYRLLRVLGQGGFAEVYLGQHVYLNTHAALKVLHVQLTQEHVQDFLKEARMIAHLEHSHIVRVLEFGVHEGRPFLVMPYAAHGNLRTCHPKGTVLPTRTLLSYVKQVADALYYAHEHKVIHRDIKPENMLVGPHHELMLSDFGIAVVAPTISSHRELQQVVGTITYMAPEQLQGRPYKATDQYALGVVVYEWLCGTPPFTGSYLEIAMQHLTAGVPSLREKIPALVPAVEQVVLKALAKEPGQRFESIAAFATALEQALRSEQKNVAGQSFPVRTVLPDSPAQTIGRHQQRPLVGREQERRRLRELLLATEQRLATPGVRSVPGAARSAWVVLLGEGGIGKTRLAEEVGREALQRGWVVALSRAYLQERTIAYRVWIEALRQILSQVRGMEEEVSQHPLRYQPLTALLPELAARLPKETVLPPPGSLEQGQLRLWEALLALLTAASEHLPVLLMLDDLQWIDGSSSALLGYVARRVSKHRLLLVGTLRQGELPSTDPLQVLLADLQREQGVTLLPLQRLSDAQIGTLVADVPPALIPQIQQQAAGNPFFAEELARGIGAQFIQAEQLYRLPTTIAALLDLRIGTLSSACQRLLAGAAVLGGSFDLRTLRAMETGPTALDEDTILSLLEEAQQKGMLTEEGTGARITYHFWHPLLVSYLYDNLSAGRHASLHRRAAEALQIAYRGREEEEAAAIAYHLVNGGVDSPQIAQYAELAGDHAYTLSAYPEAVRHYRLAVEHTGALPANASTGEYLRLANLLERLGECARVQGYYKEARRYFEQALEVRSQYHLSTSQTDPLYEAQIDALLWCEIGKTWFDIGDFEQAQQCYSHSEQVLREAEVAIGPVWASLYLEQSYILWRKGNFEEARQTALQALNIFENVIQQQDHSFAGSFYSTATRRTLEGDPVDLGRTNTLLAAIAATIGESTMALDHLNTALAIFERHERRREIAMVCGNIGDVYLRKAEHALAQAAVRRSLSIAEQIGEPGIMAVEFGNLGILSARFGDLAEAEVYYKRALTLAEQVNDPVYMSLLYSYLTPTMQDQGKVDEARKSLYQALRIGRTMSMTLGVALVALGHLHIVQALAAQENDSDSPGTVKQGSASSIRLLKRARTALKRALALEGLEAETRTEGQLTLAQASFLLGEIDTARQQAMQGMEEARRLEQIWLLVCAQRLLGEMLSAQGQREEAGTYFEQALETLQQCNMHLERARTLRSYGLALLRANASENGYTQGLRCLQEARQVFEKCHAALDLEQIDSMLSVYSKAALSSKKNVGGGDEVR